MQKKSKWIALRCWRKNFNHRCVFQKISCCEQISIQNEEKKEEEEKCVRTSVLLAFAFTTNISTPLFFCFHSLASRSYFLFHNKKLSSIRKMEQNYNNNKKLHIKELGYIQRLFLIKRIIATKMWTTKKGI